MKKLALFKHFFFLPALLLLLAACSNHEKEDRGEPETFRFLSDEEKSNYLDRKNSEEFIYLGTKTYDSIRKNYKKLEHHFIHYGDKWRYKIKSGKLVLEQLFYINENMQVGIDSAALNDPDIVKNDTVILQRDDTLLVLYNLNHAFAVNGKRYTFYHFMVDRDDTVFVYSPLEANGSVSLEGKDTVFSNDMLEPVPVHGLNIFVPYKKSMLGKILYYRGHNFVIR